MMGLVVAVVLALVLGALFSRVAWRQETDLADLLYPLSRSEDPFQPARAYRRVIGAH